MQRGLRIGRLFGINIYLDWSLGVIFLLVAWSLAASVFPAWHPDWGRGLSWAVAVAAALLFFASVLAHELSHSLVAKAYGLPVRSITLFLFGGVANIERVPPTPRSEFLIAVVGPITSILLGAIFVTLSSLSVGGINNLAGDPMQIFPRLGPVSTLSLWLGSVNVMVGLFNLIPGLPLDGGRILRSLLWAATKDLRKATRWAAGGGRLVAWALIISGIGMIFGRSLLNGFWLIFIGWFLNNAAQASYQQVLIRHLLGDISVARLMRSDVITVPPALSVSDLVYQWVMGTEERAFPVMAAGRLVGMVSLEDVRKIPRDDWERTTVGEIMTSADQLIVLSPQEEAATALEKLSRRDVRQLPVLDNGRLVGLLRRRDIVKWLQLQSDFATG